MTLTDFLVVSRLGDTVRHKELTRQLLEGFLTSKCGVVRIDYRRGQNLIIRALVDPDDKLAKHFRLDANHTVKLAIKNDIFWRDVPTFPVLEGHWPNPMVAFRNPHGLQI